MHLWVIYLIKNPVFVCEDVLDCCPKFSPAQTSGECEPRYLKTSDDPQAPLASLAMVGLGDSAPDCPWSTSSQSAPNLVNMLSQGVQCWRDGLQQDREQFVLYWRQLSPYMNMHEAYVHA